MADGDVLVLTGGHQSFSAISELASSLPRLRGFAVNASTTYTSGTVILSAGANITLGTNGQTVTISGNAAAVAQSVQSQNMVAISASDALFSSGTVVLTGAGAATVNTAAGSIRVSVPVQSAQTQSVVVLSASNASFTSGTVVLSGANGITVGTGAQQINISAEGLMSSWFHNSAMLGSAVNVGLTLGSFQLVSIAIPHAVTFSRVDLLATVSLSSSAAANTGALGFSSAAVLYSQNVSTLNPIVGALGSSTLSWASNTANFANITGNRFFSFPLATTLSAGIYVLGWHVSTASAISTGTATTALNGTISVAIGNPLAAIARTAWADFGAATSAFSNAVANWLGALSSVVTATSQTLQASQVTVSAQTVQNANVMVLFRG